MLVERETLGQFGLLWLIELYAFVLSLAIYVMTYFRMNPDCPIVWNWYAKYCIHLYQMIVQESTCVHYTSAYTNHVTMTAERI